MNDIRSMEPNDADEHRYYVDLLAPYALDALDDEERLDIAAHVDRCALCASDLAEMLDTAAVVALGETEAPPRQLWARIASDLTDDNFTAGEYTDGEYTDVRLGDAPTASVRSDRGAVSAPVIDLSQRRMARRRPPTWLSALTGAAAAVALAVPIMRATSEPTSRTPNLVQLAADQEKQQGSRRVDLLSTDGVTRVGDVVLAADGRAYVRLDKAERLTDDRTYQLWTVVNGKPVSAGLLGPSPTIAAFLVSPNAAAVALSVEQAGGASTPETGPIAIAML